ncbi:MAG: hypothetical protein CMN85_13045 [Spongiibacteraceae bacterium]|nr:hypothetical protein [Spongiibacteraceae bacterium]|tara:strand:+ start:1865 stop:2179 length:315 start_codon:yes stop_codon:yes gene_type:complete
MASHHQIESLLIDLEASLRNSGLWAAESPGAEALASTEPFAVDTMPLQGWLQFIFIPRMRVLLEAGAPMPANCAVLPVAQEAFDSVNRDLFAVIASLDKLISEA